MMPKWLQIVSLLNPLSYQVDALRNFMITNEATSFGLLLDFGVGILAFTILVVIATKTYPKILY